MVQSGDTLVLLPGMLCSQRLWAGPVARLSADVDILQPPLCADGVEEMVDDVLQAASPRFSLAGLSLGGIVAMALVRRAPERVARLALFSTNPRGPRSDQLAAWAEAQARLGPVGTAREEQRRLLPALLHPGTVATRPDLVQTVLAMADEIGEVTLSRQLRAQATRIDERPWLTAVRCPTLVVAASDDALCGVGLHEEIVDAVPGAQLEILQCCGHLSPLEHPAAVASLLDGWLCVEKELDLR